MKKRRRGFSLIVVLIVSLLGLAIVGATVQMTFLSSGAGRFAASGVDKYNFLQDAVEEGKAHLKKLADFPRPNHPNPYPSFIPRYTDKAGVTDATSITSADILLIEDGVISRPLDASTLRKLGIRGSSGSLTIQIYDMQYDPEKVPSGITQENLAHLPPSIIMVGSDPWRIKGDTKAPDKDDSESYARLHNNGAYLVRATLRVGGEVSTLESAILQSNNM